jgi:catechol 2,3-dioxygenase-like lactoylglutathione lyase family enzyme
MNLPHLQSVGFTCRDAEELADWYGRWLGFQPGERREHHADAYAALIGLPGASLIRQTLHLGEERLELHQVCDPGPGARPGRPVPADSRSNDLWFQHICLVTPAMDAVAPPIEAQIAGGGLRPISSAPQRLPDWNPGAAGIVAFKFQDPDGHPLELLQFPADKGDARWHGQTTPTVLGIDHSAIGIRDPERTARFYGELLGLPHGGGGINRGVEQDHLDGLEHTEVQIGSWRPAEGMGIETLGYRSPAGGRPQARDCGAQDLSHWQLRLQVEDLEAIASRVEAFGGALVSPGIVDLAGSLPGVSRAVQLSDPDGHRLQLVSA